MKLYTLSISLSIIAVFFCHQLHARSWIPVGPNDTNKIACTYSTGHMAINKRTGDIFVAYPDRKVNGKVTVRKYNGSTWSTVGGRGVTPNQVFTNMTDIAVDDYDDVYLLYPDSANGRRATVQVYNGTRWSVVGYPGFSGGPIESVYGYPHAMTLDTNGYPYVLYSDSTHAGKATVKRYYGGAWLTVGVAGFSAGYIFNPTIKIDRKTNLPFVAYTDGGYSNKVAVMKFNGTAWVYPGPPAASDTAAYSPSLVIDSNSNPIVAYEDAGAAYNITVKTLQSGYWTTVGTRGLAYTFSDNPALALDQSGVPYLFAGGKLFMYNSASWVSASDNINNSESNEMEITYNNDLYISTSTEQCKVYKQNGYSWQRLDTGGISGDGSAQYLKIAVDTNGTPYAAYIKDNRINIKRYSGSHWADLDSGLYYSGYTDWASSNIVINKVTNEPYIAFVDTTARAVVKRYDGTRWQDVGSPLFLTDKIFNISLTISASGTPYISFVKFSSYKASVMKYSVSSGWTTLGMPDFTDTVYYLSNIIADNDTSYIAYTNSIGTLTCMRYDGSSWGAIGNTLIPSYKHSYIYPILAINKNGILYLGYTVSYLGNSDTVVIKKLNGSYWQSVNSSLSTTSLATLSSLLIDNTNHPVIAYWNGDIFHGSYINYASVKRYNGEEWEYIGDSNLSPGDAFMPYLALTSNNTLYCSYINSQFETGGDAFVRKFINIPTDTLPDTSTSVKNIEPARSNDLYAYPVPCTDHITIAGWNLSKDGNKLYVYDISGKLAYSVTIKSNRINTASWPSGIYFLQTESKKTIKLIKY